MRQVLPKTLFGQLVVGTVVVQTVFLVLFIWYIVGSQSRAAELRSRQRITQQLTRLAAASENPLMSGDAASLQDVLALSHISPTVEAARITDLKGNTLAISDTDKNHGLDTYEQAALAQPADLKVFQIKNGQIEGVAPILHDGRPVALLWLEPNHSATLNTVAIVVQVSVTYGIFALLASIIPIFVVVRSVTKPLRRLREATQRLVQSQDLDTVAILPVTTQNEVGDLTKSFNYMVLKLEEQRSGLLETLALLDSLLGAAPIGFAFFDQELHYVRINQFLATLHGQPMEDHIGHRCTSIYPASIAEQKEACIRRVFETGEAIRDVELSGETIHSSGTQRSWLMHFYPVKTRQKIMWVGTIVVEITERLRAEEALRKTEKLAATGRLAASIAHEINNPLEAVTNLLYLLETHEALDPDASNFVSTAQAELARVSEITQQMLRFHRQSTLPVSTNIAEVLNSVTTLYQTRITSANITITRNFRHQAEVFGYGGELRQLFANLIGNAVDAMPDGGRLYLRIRRGYGPHPNGEQGEGVRVSVSDNGSGMSEETRQRIFEAFFTTKQASGTGLGLWVSEEIIRKHSAVIRVKSRQGANSGTSFMLFFPDLGNTGSASPAAQQTNNAVMQ